MYTPSHFSITEREHIHHVMVEHPFAMLIGPDGDGVPFVTHVPLVTIQSGDTWLLDGHMARANPHWKWLQAQKHMLAVFSGPHTYISPSFYDNRLSVPTWNYIAVHAYGDLELIDDASAKDALLKTLIAQHEPAYAATWRGLPDDFQQKMLGAIVGFRIRVTKVEAKFKVSQNRPAADRERIKANHRVGNEDQRELVKWMERLGS